MAVTARDEWTDARIDDFKETVNQRFDQVDRRFDQVDKRFELVDKRFDLVDKRFERVDRQFAEVKNEISELRQTMIHGFFVLVGINATSTLTLIGLKFL
jgi:archaellum component FlaC